MKETKKIFHIPKKISDGGTALMKEKKMKIVFIAATRTPFGEVGGAFKDIPPIELGAFAARGAIKQAGLEGRDGHCEELRQKAESLGGCAD